LNLAKQTNQTTMPDNYKGIPINTSKNTHSAVFSLITAPKEAVIADILSGAGAFVKRLTDNGFTAVVAMDIEKSLVIDHEQFLYGDMTKPLPFAGNTVDVFICIDGIEHINTQFGFVAEVRRVTKMGGEFILSTPNISSLRSRMRWLLSGHHHKCNSPLDENNPNPLHHIGMISFPELRYLLHTNGFKVEKVATNRIKPISWLYGLLVPMAWIFTSFSYAKAARRDNTAVINHEVRKSMFSLPVLFGETIIIRARKVN